MPGATEHRPPGAQRLQGPLQRLWHLLIVVGGWVLFAWLWALAIANQEAPLGLQVLVVGTALLAPLITIGWVAHNVGIYLRKGPRRGLPAPQPRPRVDFNGRRIEADWDRLVQAAWVNVEIDGGVKRFVAVRSVTPPPP